MAAARHPAGFRLSSLPLLLCWHKVERRRELGVTRLAPRRFERQIERLARAGWKTLTLRELRAVLAGSRRPGEREMVLTFDDAYRGLRENAFPVLVAHGYSAVCSVITDYAGRLNRWDVAYGGRRFAHLAWRDVETWRARGIEFVSHSATHPRLTWLGDADLASEMTRSRTTMESRLGERCEVISYPFGAAGVREREAAAAAGYTLGLTLVTEWTGDAMAVPRLPVYMWSPPAPGIGLLRHAERLAAIGANRCAVGTTVWQRLRTREV